MALSRVARYSMRPGGSLIGQNSYIVKNGIKIYHGALVGTDPNSGYLQNWQQSSGTIRFKGLAMPRGARSTDGSVTGDTSATPKPECEVNESGVILEGISVTGATQLFVGEPVYATDNNTFTVSATTNVGAVGTLVGFRSSSDCDVQLHTPGEYDAMQSYGKV